MKQLPDVEALRALLDYDPETGVLTWRDREGNGHHSKRWNARFAGETAFTYVSREGYHVGCIHNVSYQAHRIIWKHYYGEDPLQIDHINGIRTDNRIENLRSVTNQENSKNVRINSNNTSGHVGVYWDKARKKWMAHITAKGRRIKLGSFDILEEAVAARKAANIEYGFHENHGRKAL